MPRTNQTLADSAPRLTIPVTNHSTFRLVSFCPYYPPHVGGLEKFADALHRLLADHGHHVTVFTAHLPPPPNSSFDYGDISVLKYPAFDIIFGYPVPKFWDPDFWRLYFRLSDTKYDFVLSSTRFFLSSLLALFFAKFHHLPLIHIEHGSEYVQSDSMFVTWLARLYDETLGRLVLRSSTCNISPSRSAQAFIARFDHRPSPLIYRGVSPRDIDHIPAAALDYIHAGQLPIVFAGRLIDAKGVADLLQALVSLPRSRYFMSIIGSGPAQPALISLVTKLQLSSNVKFLGPLSHRDTIAQLKAAAICVNPSYNEGLPTVLLEAGLTGCAIIATAVGGTTEIIRHQYSGLLFQPADQAALSTHLSMLINNSALRAKLATNAKQSIIKQFDLLRTYRQYLSVFHNCRQQ